MNQYPGVAISFRHVTKRYRLGGGLNEQLKDALGISWLGRGKPKSNFVALDDVTFSLPRGKRMGLIGRNGAGKTTLLKLISGNFKPSEGRVTVNGSVQALMIMGQGFHPDYTGRENISASLHYNGLSSFEVRAAFDDVIDFCELGRFIDEPFRAYSSGMQSRLMFATATAIKPDILIIDEVLGAGDAYFLIKSKRRIDQIVERGCTLLLVSHSMGQVLELCEDAIWLEGGRIKQWGHAFEVVKAYEEAMYGAMLGSGDPSAARRTSPRELPASTQHPVAASPAVLEGPAVPSSQGAIPHPLRHAYRTPLLQIPTFRPHEQEFLIPQLPDTDGRTLRYPDRGGVSRWPGHSGLKIVGFTVSGPQGPTARLISLQPALFTIFLEAEESRSFQCTYGLAINDLQGRVISRFFSPPDRFVATAGDGRRINIMLNPNQLGPGLYTIGISIHDETTIEQADSATRYDLLNRSFSLTVELPDSLAPASAAFFHSSEWSFSHAELPAELQTAETSDR
jgi:homopolymeric O-antigen transport system ATP-binding protein